ncbi:hypothetical protein T484DRAFT_1814918, partial [Baffinella frigidus]
VVVDNNGEHGTKEQCATTQLTTGDHLIVGHWFKNNHGPNYEIKWQGADTANNKMFLGSNKMPTMKPAYEIKWKGADFANNKMFLGSNKMPTMKPAVLK